MSANEESNERLNRASLDGPIPADLKQLESQLAELRPRTDRLDRDRLMFLAGQASVARPAAKRLRARSRASWTNVAFRSAKAALLSRSERRQSGARRWMPSPALAAMTAVAATLLVMLVMRFNTPPEVQVVERIVEVPAKGPLSESAMASGHSQSAQRLDGQTPARSRSLADLNCYFQLRDQWLAGRADGPSAPPAPAEQGRPPQRPATYRELREGLLNDPAALAVPLDQPQSNARSSSGVHS